MARRTAQDSFEQSNRLLREAVTREKIHVGERLRDKFLRFFVKGRLTGDSRGFDRYFRSGFFFVVDWQFGGRSLRDLRAQVFLGKIFCLSRRQLSHFTENAVEFALCRIAVRIAVDKLLKDLFCALPLVTGDQGVSQVRQRIRQTEGIAGAAIKFHQPFQRLQGTRHACCKFVE